MKIEWLIGILSILLQQEKVTAPMLAEKFEVSRRTINRDVEELCRAGIPIVTEHCLQQRRCRPFRQGFRAWTV